MEQKAKIKGVLLDLDKDTAEVVEFIPSLKNYYEMLHCDMIEIACRKIGVRRGRVYDIICDEEVTFKEDAKISAINDLGQPMLVGSLLVVGLANDEGDETSLTDDDCDFIMDKVCNLSTHKYPVPYKMLTQCEYA